MKLEDAMLLWMPVDAEIYHGNPRQGRVKVVERGHNDSEFPMSGGSCDIDWNDASTHGERIEMLQELVSTMVWENGVSKETVMAALKVIDDVNPLQLDLDKKPAD